MADISDVNHSEIKDLFESLEALSCKLRASEQDGQND
jgi:hypothetical protein